MNRENYPKILLAIYVIVWIITAISPVERNTWIYENILVVLFIPFLIFTYKKFRFSNLSYTLIFLFMIFHAIGAYYTYAATPLGVWMQNWFGFERNHFDRIIHFGFGFLMAYPIREIFMRIASTRGVWNYYLPFELTLAFSAIFELLEWFLVAVSNPVAGENYLGMQGDIWDAQKDMGLAGLGAALAMAITRVFNRKKD